MSAEMFVGVLATAGLVLVGCWRMFRLFFSGKPGPNPWDEDTEARLHEPNAVSLCPRCLEPQTQGTQFCRDCGFAVGPYVLWSPYLYVFALGDLLRTGVDRPFRVKATTVGFFLMVSLVEYVVFAPVYWFFLLRNIRRQSRENGVS